MEQLYCSVLNCNTPLKTVSEVTNGFCNSCLEKLDDRRYYAGLCWHCQTLTFIGLRKLFVRTLTNKYDVDIVDKYICAKGCSKCSNDPQAGIMWMTTNRNQPPVSAVSESGAIVPYKDLVQEESYSINNTLDAEQKE